MGIIYLLNDLSLDRAAGDLDNRAVNFMAVIAHVIGE
jgi:hypothetical protein